MLDRRIIVISDLHICAGELDCFIPELENAFCNFIVFLLSNKSPLELVINGDFLDFIYAPPWKGNDLESISQDSESIPLCFTEEQSLAKLEAILKKHENVFKIIFDFLRFNPENRLVILPGNHAPDFFWLKVQNRFKDFICGLSTNITNQLNIFLEQIYQPDNLPSIWIEHGNQYDPLNSFSIGGKLYWGKENKPILKDIHEKERLVECVGTRILLKYLLKLIDDFPNIPNIKPTSNLIKYFISCALRQNIEAIKIFSALWGLANFLTILGINKPQDIMGFHESIDPRTVLKSFFKKMPIDKENEFINKLEYYGFKIKLQINTYLESQENATNLMNFISDNSSILEGFEDKSSRYLGFDETDGTLSLFKKAINITLKKEIDVLGSRAKQILKNNNCNSVIFGHTHEKDDSIPNYINTGSWTRYFIGPIDQEQNPCLVLKNKNFESFSYYLYYAEITADNEMKPILIPLNKK